MCKGIGDGFARRGLLSDRLSTRGNRVGSRHGKHPSTDVSFPLASEYAFAPGFLFTRLHVVHCTVSEIPCYWKTSSSLAAWSSQRRLSRIHSIPVKWRRTTRSVKALGTCCGNERMTVRLVPSLDRTMCRMGSS